MSCASEKHKPLLLLEEPGIERELLCEVLARETHHPVVIEQDCQLARARAMHVSLLLLSLGTPSEDESFFAFIEQWIVDVPRVPIILLCPATRIDCCQKAIHLGVHGLLSKTEKLETIIAAIVRVMNGDKWYSPMLVQKCFIKPKEESKHIDNVHKLKQRDIEIIHLISKEKTLNEIAHTLYISESTVRKRLGELYQKYQVEGQIGLVVHALKNGDLKDN